MPMIIQFRASPLSFPLSLGLVLRVWLWTERATKAGTRGEFKILGKQEWLVQSLVLAMEKTLSVFFSWRRLISTVPEDETEKDRMLNNLLTTAVCEKYVEIGTKKFVLPIYFKENWESSVNKFKVLDDGVFVLGHPKTGLEEDRNNSDTEDKDNVEDNVVKEEANTLKEKIVKPVVCFAKFITVPLLVY
ncbi:hypothetical protein ILUMI_24373 [Ignelater luminosus]|uniref:Uncharacterized protein n=1 Tax=Ignelater luminosus TaxID=2038154 RepID=A0A8K0FYU1_IGNLU|nr:hypothetical protein ILUMI_24373 [Ignelater luminosus]